MDVIYIPASITIENGISVQHYKWKSENKFSVYRRPTKRAFVRITSLNFVKNLVVKGKEKRKVRVSFFRKNKTWVIKISRIKKEGLTLQPYLGSHPYLQLVLNKSLPKVLWDEHESSGKKTHTIPVKVGFELDEWNDIGLNPQDFLPQVEKMPKRLMEESLKWGFKVDYIPKGRSYDLELIGPNGRIFLLALSSHVAKNKSRSKEQRTRKILMDISKMLPAVYIRKVCPVIVCEPLEFDGSWSFTTADYLGFYRDKFNFKFLTTDFKKGWEHKICKELLELDKGAL